MAVGGMMSPGGNTMMSPPHSASSGNMSPRPGSNDGFGMGPRPPMSPRGPSPGMTFSPRIGTHVRPLLPLIYSDVIRV